MQRFLIAGLGNPGIKYERHRHNVGFMVLDELASRQNATFAGSRGKSLYSTIQIHNTQLVLVKPQTYMNRSGETLQNLLHFYRLPMERALIVFDDLDLPTAMLRMRPYRGSAGHKGMKSIIDRLGSQTIPRLRIGIDRPTGPMNPAAYVLLPFDNEQQELISAVLPRAADAIETFVISGIQKAMSTFHN